MRLRLPSQKKKDEHFRYGQSFNLKNIKFAMQRNPLIYKWTHGIVNNSIGDGIKIVNTEDAVKGGAELQEDWMIEASDFVNSFMKPLKNAFAWDRGDGQSLILVYKPPTGDDIIVKAYPRADYQIEYEEITGKILEIKVTDRVGGKKARAKDRTLTSKEMEFAIEILTWESEVIGDGIPQITPIWDTSYSLFTTDANQTKFIIRVGGGLFVAYIPEGKMLDTAYMAKVDATMDAMNSVEQKMKIPKADRTDASSAEIKQLDSNQPMNASESQNQFITSASLATGYPTEAFKGNEKGMRSAEVNQEETFSIHQDVRSNYSTVFYKLIDMFNRSLKWYGFDTKGEEITDLKRPFQVDYIKRFVMTEDEELDQNIKKIDFVEMAHRFLTEEDIQTITGFKITKPEPLDLTPGTGDEGDKETEEERIAREEEEKKKDD